MAPDFVPESANIAERILDFELIDHARIPRQCAVHTIG